MKWVIPLFILCLVAIPVLGQTYSEKRELRNSFSEMIELNKKLTDPKTDPEARWETYKSLTRKTEDFLLIFARNGITLKLEDYSTLQGVEGFMIYTTKNLLNLHDFKEKFNFLIDNNGIVLVPKTPLTRDLKQPVPDGLKFTFTHIIRKRDGKLYLEDGTFDGFPVREALIELKEAEGGLGTVFDVAISAEGFGGFSFSQPVSFVITANEMKDKRKAKEPIKLNLKEKEVKITSVAEGTIHKVHTLGTITAPSNTDYKARSSIVTFKRATIYYDQQGDIVIDGGEVVKVTKSDLFPLRLQGKNILLRTDLNDPLTASVLRSGTVTYGEDGKLEVEGKAHFSGRSYGGVYFEPYTDYSVESDEAFGDRISLKDVVLSKMDRRFSGIISGENIQLDPKEKIILEKGAVAYLGRGENVPRIFPEKMTTINGIAVQSSDPVPFFFDGGDHSGERNFISLDRSRKKLSAKSDRLLILKLEKNNDIVQVDKKVVIATIHNGWRFSLENRDAQGLVPKLAVGAGSAEKGGFRYFNGGASLIFRKTNNDIYVGSAVRKIDAVPLAVYFGNRKLLISQHGESGFVRPDVQEKEMVKDFKRYLLTEKLVYQREPSLRGNPTLKILNVEVAGGGAWAGEDLDKKLSATEKKNLVNYLKFIPKEILKTKRIVIWDDATWEKEYSHASGVASADINIGEIMTKFFTGKWGDVFSVPNRFGTTLQVPVSALPADPGVFYHENAHLYHSYLNENKPSFERNWRTTVLGQASEGKYDFYRYLSNIIPGPGYGERASWNRVEWKDGSREPRYGFITEYSANNIKEDVAETAEEIVSSPEKYRDIVNPTSSYYQKRLGKDFGDGPLTQQEASRWARTYLMKAMLLREVKLIDEETYLSIWNAAPRSTRDEAVIMARRMN